MYSVFVSGYTEDGHIWIYNMNERGGLSLLRCQTPVGPNPTFMTVTGDRLYAIHGVGKWEGADAGGLTVLKIDEGQILRRLQTINTAGKGPAHIAVDPFNSYVYVCNYHGGSFAAFPLAEDGSVEPVVQYREEFGKGSKVHDRQDSSHPHDAFNKGKLVYVCDLGADKIWHFTFKEGKLVKGSPEFTAIPPGSGPRHLALHPTLDNAYLINELNNTIIAYRINKDTGQLVQLACHSTLPDDATKQNYAAGIMIHPNGKYLYSSNRGNGSITAYDINQTTGELDKYGIYPIKGTWPRHFNITPCGRFLLCADQFSNSIEVFQINENTGELKSLSCFEGCINPTIVVFQ